MSGGLFITPDGTSRASVIAGETSVLYGFVVANTGNFTNKVRFLADGNGGGANVETAGRRVFSANNTIDRNVIFAILRRGRDGYVGCDFKYDYAKFYLR